MHAFKFLLLISIVSILFSSERGYGKTPEGNNDPFVKLYSLLNDEEFFKFRNLLDASKDDLQKWQYLYFEMVFENLNNKPELSNNYGNSLITELGEELPDSLKKNVYGTMATNFVHLGNYSKASEFTDFILDSLSLFLDKEEIENYENTSKIWEICKGVPRQTTIINADSRIEFGSSFAGKTLEVSINGNENEFIFDTGANFSVMMKSYAEKVGISILKGTFKVNSIAGVQINSEIGYADEMIIGNMVFRNVLFLVFPDEALTFSMGLSLEAIIGFPVIRDMKQIQISQNDLFVPKNPDIKRYHNFVLNGFTPVVEVITNEDSLSFVFDTGATNTMLFSPYFEKHKNEIVDKYEEEEISVEGAGGAVRYMGFILDKVELKVGNITSTINNIELLSEPIQNQYSKYYGNLGRDYIFQHKSYIINFESMFIDFKD